MDERKEGLSILYISEYYLTEKGIMSIIHKRGNRGRVLLFALTEGWLAKELVGQKNHHFAVIKVEIGSGKKHRMIDYHWDWLCGMLMMSRLSVQAQGISCKFYTANNSTWRRTGNHAAFNQVIRISTTHVKTFDVCVGSMWMCAPSFSDSVRFLQVFIMLGWVLALGPLGVWLCISSLARGLNGERYLSKDLMTWVWSPDPTMSQKRTDSQQLSFNQSKPSSQPHCPGTGKDTL